MAVLTERPADASPCKARRPEEGSKDAGPSAVDQIRGYSGPAGRCRAGSVPSRVHRNARSHRVTRVGAFTLNEAHTLVPTRTATNSSSASIRHKTMRYGGAPFRQGPGILKMVRLHLEAACTVEGDRPRGRLASLHRQLVALPTNIWAWISSSVSRVTFKITF